MVPHHYKIKKNKDIQRLKHASVKHGEFVTVRFGCNANTPVWRGLVTVSKKYSKRAVHRNKLRRRIWYILYQLSRQSRIPPQFDYHITIKPKNVLPLTSYTDLYNDICAVFERLHERCVDV